jgi:hypothetical protein
MRFAVLFVTLTAVAAEPPRFREHVVTANLVLGYQMSAVDLNHDGRLDLLPVDERATELVWYENPGWQRHLILGGVARVINLDTRDLNGDGIPEIAVAEHFETSPARSDGIVLLLHSGSDPREPWTAREIDRVPTAHRVRWIDPIGDGSALLLVAPMIGPRATPPLYDDRVPIYGYRPGEWRRETLTDAPHGILHSIHPYPWRGKPAQQLLTASFSGLQVFDRGRQGRWQPTLLASGDPRPCPQCGSSEIKVGHLGRRRFLAAIEPWHGNQVVVYTGQGRSWRRHVLDDSFENGHALAVGDLDGDHRDEIVAGFRGKGFRLYLYRADDKDGAHWTRSILDDGGIAAADCKIADFTGDGRPDIACIGASTKNIKLYEALPR